MAMEHSLVLAVRSFLLCLLLLSRCFVQAWNPPQPGVAAPSYWPNTCRDVFINVTATASVYSVPSLDDLTAPGAVIGFLASIPSITSANQMQKVGGNYTIKARYCPSKSYDSTWDSTVQLLVHGLSYSSDYWAGDALPGRNNGNDSYVQWTHDPLNLATISIDRLGYGGSSHPDPTIIQNQLSAEVIYQVILKLKDGTALAGKRYPRVIPIGHSTGSGIVTELVRAHPDAANGIVLTSFSLDISNTANIIPRLDFGPAVNYSQTRFGGMDQGYLFPRSFTTRNTSWYHPGNYGPDVPMGDFNNALPVPVGELIQTGIQPVQNYKGPVGALTGEFDEMYCGTATPGNCNPVLQSGVAGLYTTFPKSKRFEPSLVPNTGFAMENHNTANRTSWALFDFISRNLEVYPW